MVNGPIATLSNAKALRVQLQLQRQQQKQQGANDSAELSADASATKHKRNTGTPKGQRHVSNNLQSCGRQQPSNHDLFYCRLVWAPALRNSNFPT